jgi:hypothetical protein
MANPLPIRAPKPALTANDRWTNAEAEEHIRLIDSLTLFAVHYIEIPSAARRGDVVYYNPVVKQKD